MHKNAGGDGVDTNGAIGDGKINEIKIETVEIIVSKSRVAILELKIDRGNLGRCRVGFFVAAGRMPAIVETFYDNALEDVAIACCSMARAGSPQALRHSSNAGAV